MQIIMIAINIQYEKMLTAKNVFYDKIITLILAAGVSMLVYSHQEDPQHVIYTTTDHFTRHTLLKTFHAYFSPDYTNFPKAGKQVLSSILDEYKTRSV